ALAGDDLAAPLPGDYVVLASFADEARANRALGLYKEYQPRLLNAEVKGKPYLRVAVGPLSAEHAHDLRLLAAKKGVKDPWIVGVGATGE
ncbi:SPOR domain-containing protein, partial [Thalassospira sp. UBA1131]